jgi:hypothetical protein
VNEKVYRRIIGILSLVLLFVVIGSIWLHRCADREATALEREAEHLGSLIEG